MEREIVSAAIVSRESYDVLVSKGIMNDLSPSGQIIFQILGTYYDSDAKATSANVDLIVEYIRQKYPKHVDGLSRVLNDLPDVSAINVVELWLASKRDLIGRKLSSALIENKDAQVSQLMEEYNFYKTYKEQKARTFQSATVRELLETENTTGQIPLYPKCLNDAIGGGLDPGMQVVVFGRPDSGKTQFLLNAAGVMVQRGMRVLYGGNEDPAKRILMRFISRLADMDYEEVRADPDGAFDKAVKVGYDNFIYHELIPGTIGEIRSLVEKYKPDVLFVDQIRNLKFHGAEGLTQVLERAVIELRNLAKEYGIVVISVTQAGDSANNKLQLEMNDIEYSNTGVAAQADLMVGIGLDENLRQQNKLVLNICKNKINGAYPILPVRVNRARSKIKSDV